MNKAPTVSSLYKALQEKLGLQWVAGQRGENRAIQGNQEYDPNISLVGHLNFIHPHRVQVVGNTELNHLQKLRKNTRTDFLTQLFSGLSGLVVIGEDLTPPEELQRHAEESSTPLFRSPLSSQALVNHLQYYLSALLAEKITLHGVFLEILGVGVLITGTASIGKSELALELVGRGHRLVADDAPEFARTAPDVLNGRCPEMLQDFLEVRGLGILDVRAMFGDSAIKRNRNLRLIVRLEDMSDNVLGQIDRLHGSHALRRVLGVDVPEVTLPVAPGRNLAVLAEAAVRNHLLHLKGYDASAEFMRRQSQYLDQETP